MTVEKKGTVTFNRRARTGTRTFDQEDFESSEPGSNQDICRAWPVRVATKHTNPVANTNRASMNVVVGQYRSDAQSLGKLRGVQLFLQLLNGLRYVSLTWSCHCASPSSFRLIH